jgi:hypothetical protein
VGISVESIARAYAAAGAAEKSFGPDLQRAREQEREEWLDWHNPLNRWSRALKRLTPESPKVEEKFRLSSPNYLHVAAREVWKTGGYSEREWLVQLLYQDPTADKVLNLDEQLRITFEPRGNNTRKWGLEPSVRAQGWLVDRVLEPQRFKSVICVQVDPETVEARVKGDLSKYMDPELRDFISGDSYGSILPKRQAQVLYLYSILHDPSRPRETVAAVAEEMGITPATVRGYLAAARRNPELRDELRSLQYEFYKSFQTTKRLSRISNTE